MFTSSNWSLPSTRTLKTSMLPGVLFTNEELCWVSAGFNLHVCLTVCQSVSLSRLSLGLSVDATKSTVWNSKPYFNIQWDFTEINGRKCSSFFYRDMYDFLIYFENLNVWLFQTRNAMYLLYSGYNRHINIHIASHTCQLYTLSVDMGGCGQKGQNHSHSLLSTLAINQLVFQ